MTGKAGAVKVELIDSAKEFIAATTAFRAADPLRTNVIGSVSLAVSTDRTSYDDYRWWIVRNDDGDVVGVAMRTSPFNMVVAPMPADAARALGEQVGRFDDELPGVSGPKDLMNALLEGYVESKSPGSTRVPHQERLDLLYELEDLITPDVEGVGRPARAEEVEALSTMLVEFAHEVALPSLSADDARESVKKSVDVGSLFCWELADDIVAIAGHAPLVTTDSTVIGRIGPVFTPKEFRRRGFGAAVTAHVSHHLLERGARVMLFTDAANPTSNAIYQEIGYRLVDELVLLRFE